MWLMRSKFSVLARRTMPTTRYPRSRSHSARCDPSCPVMPVITAVVMRPSFPAAVPILEPHHVVQFGRRHLEDVRVLEGDHAVPEPGRDVPPVSGAEVHEPRRLALASHLEAEDTGENPNRLVLLAVVLQAERVPGAYV